MYGLEITRSLVATDGLAMSQGTIYPLLARLRRTGLVETSWEEAPHGPPRRYYQLTAHGQTALNDFATVWNSFRGSIDSIIRQ